MIKGCISTTDETWQIAWRSKLSSLDCPSDGVCGLLSDLGRRGEYLPLFSDSYSTTLETSRRESITTAIINPKQITGFPLLAFCAPFKSFGQLIHIICKRKSQAKSRHLHHTRLRSHICTSSLTGGKYTTRSQNMQGGIYAE